MVGVIQAAVSTHILLSLKDISQTGVLFNSLFILENLNMGMSVHPRPWWDSAIPVIQAPQI